jgi:hypothetical protein
MTAELLDQHKAIIEAAEQILAIVQRVPRATTDQLARARVKLGSLMVAHLQSDEKLILAPLRAPGATDALPGAAPIIVALREFRRLYSEHISTWSIRAIEQDPDGYIAATTALLDHFKLLSVREERELYRPFFNALQSGHDQDAALRA